MTDLPRRFSNEEIHLGSDGQSVEVAIGTEPPPPFAGKFSRVCWTGQGIPDGNSAPVGSAGLVNIATGKRRSYRNLPLSWRLAGWPASVRRMPEEQLSRNDFVNVLSN